MSYGQTQDQIGAIQARITARQQSRVDGFSMIELLIVLVIIITVASVAVPMISSAVRSAHLRGAASDLASLYEQGRILAIRDNRYYSTYILAASGNQPEEAYVDMLPQRIGQASGNQGSSVVVGDPVVTLSSDVTPQAASSAPNTSNLQNQLLPSTTSVTPVDTTVTAAIFGPRGLPCTPISLSSESICDSAGGPTAYWTFLQNSTTGAWEAVTITPAGRIRKWFYNGSTWSKL
jgi:prepilin-type N-terminal cleavage/methylation domain-containing protein